MNRFAAQRERSERHKKSSRFHLELARHESALLGLIEELRARPLLDDRAYQQVLRRYPKDAGVFAKSDIIQAFRHLAPARGWAGEERAFLDKLRMKPVRTGSGVTPVTVLTKPFPCPGRCIFCPNDTQMPKSYLAMEPGAQRATQNRFDPYRQTWSRLRAFHNNGHSLDKVELIILGGTWSYYPEAYQVWFVRRCFEALNDFPGRDHAPDDGDGLDFLDLEERLDGRDLRRSYNEVVGGYLRERLGGGLLAKDEQADWDSLARVHEANEGAANRCIGLVVETRPDCVDKDEVQRIRRLGATKVQIGIQSLDDEVLALNRRGHDVAATRRAIALLRGAGFKIHAHWMPNLYGSTPARDVTDFARLFDDPDFRPDELKVYPLSLIESTELMVHHEAGRFHPYQHDELVDVLARCMTATPRYCRLTRVIRDIPSHDIVVGNQTSNLREVAEQEVTRRGERVQDIRARQIRRAPPPPDEWSLRETAYRTSTGEEVFLELHTADDELLGFLRLALPDREPPIDELRGRAVIREVHVYGPVAALGERERGRSQHAGAGRRLIEHAEGLVREAGFRALAVISAVGTREYYRRLGYADRELYLHREIVKEPTETRPLDRTRGTGKGPEADRTPA